MSFRHEALAALIDAHFAPDVPRRWCVALSAGLDSTVLLHAMSRVLSDLEPRGEHRLRAMHVHHGLYPDAEAWTEAARAQAASLGCEFQVLKVSVQKAPGQSLEDCARQVRYQALMQAMDEGEILLTGHHQDDQLETVLLQLMRGAGVAGLAAMPACAAFGSGRHFRPLLDFSREELRHWASHRGVQWIEEPSNQDMNFDRNYLRHRVLPALMQRWPSAARGASRSARYCGEARELLEQLAGDDYQRCSIDGDLLVQELLALEKSRTANLVRYWVGRAGLPSPPAHVLALLPEQVLNAKAQALPCLSWQGAEIRRYRGRLIIQPNQAPRPSGSLPWPATAVLELPGGLGQLSLDEGPGPGLDPGALEGKELEIRFRLGGEKLRLAGREGSHGLRDLFQDRGVLPWMRDRVPLIYVDGKLAAVGQFWIDQAFASKAGGEARLVVWKGAPRLVL
jgi:tRNA(Ile)-lysidine synthase